MASAWITKDPAEVKEYSFDWSGQFVYDYITTSKGKTLKQAATLTVTTK